MKKQLNITKKLGFLTLALAMAIVTLLTIATPVMADAPVSHTITLLSGGTTQTAGYTLNNPVANPRNPSLYSGSGNWSAAPVITDQPDVWVQFGGAKWVSTTAADSGTEGGYTGNSWRLLRDQFTVPTGANITSATLRIASDNAFELYFNDTFIDSTALWGPDTTVYGPSPEPVDNETPFRAYVTYTIYPHVGTNTFDFVLRNWDNLGLWNPTGLLYAASITYEVSSGPPVAVGGTVFPVDKYQLLLPWFGVGLGALLVVFLAINRLFFRKRQRTPNR
jgi:hypothetical protein